MFHCVHFECPAQEESTEEQGSAGRIVADTSQSLTANTSLIPAPPLPPPLPDLNPRPMPATDRESPEDGESEEEYLPRRFTAGREGSFLAHRFVRQ